MSPWAGPQCSPGADYTGTWILEGNLKNSSSYAYHTDHILDLPLRYLVKCCFLENCKYVKF